MTANTAHCRRIRFGFSLVELLVVVLIIAILATLVLGAYTGSLELGREGRTRAQIAKIDSLLTPLWEQFRTRRVPLPAGVSGLDAARQRLAMLRELQRFELPDRLTDLQTAASRDPKTLPLRTQLYLKIAQKLAPNWLSGSAQNAHRHQGSECLYLILASIHDRDVSGLSFFRNTEMQDTDGDGMKEIIDGWGKPIDFIRWAPGFKSDKQEIEDAEWINENPDPFDPLEVDTAQGGLNADSKTFYLYPLIFSAGPDGKYHIATDAKDEESGGGGSWINYNDVENNPYATFGGARLGQGNEDGKGYRDNIHNHLVRAKVQ